MVAPLVAPCRPAGECVEGGTGGRRTTVLKPDSEAATAHWRWQAHWQVEWSRCREALGVSDQSPSDDPGRGLSLPTDSLRPLSGTGRMP